jgi:hypothetical protein
MTKITKPAAVSGETNAAVLSERLRVAAILESPEGKRNPAMAHELAFRQALDAEQAITILSLAPTPQVVSPYLAAMAKEGPVNLSAATADLSGDPKAARIAEIKANVHAFNVSKGYVKAEG